MTQANHETAGQPLFEFPQPRQAAMKTRLPWSVLLALVAGLMTGCQSRPAAVPTAGNPSLRNNCYSLLHQLLNDEKGVGLLRFIKSEAPDVKELVKRIATTCGTGAKLLEKLAQDDPSLHLDDISLPPGELATRAAIAATKQKELLGQSGETFELTLLLTQTEALSYGWHLAEVASLNERNPEQARALAGIGVDLHQLNDEVFALLRSRAFTGTTNTVSAPPP